MVKAWTYHVLHFGCRTANKVEDLMENLRNETIGTNNESIFIKWKITSIKLDYKGLKQ